MQRKRFSEEQIIKILQAHEAGVPLADLAREYGFAEGTIYTCKATYGGMSVSEAKRLKELDSENQKLKKLLAEQYPRYGSPLLHAMLRQEGLVKNYKRTYRLYTEERLQVRTKRRKRLRRPRVPLVVPSRCNERWSVEGLVPLSRNGCKPCCS